MSCLEVAAPRLGVAWATPPRDFRYLAPTSVGSPGISRVGSPGSPRHELLQDRAPSSTHRARRPSPPAIPGTAHAQHGVPHPHFRHGPCPTWGVEHPFPAPPVPCVAQRAPAPGTPRAQQGQSLPPGAGFSGAGLAPSLSFEELPLRPFTVAIAVRSASNSARTEGRFRKMKTAAARTSL